MANKKYKSLVSTGLTFMVSNVLSKIVLSLLLPLYTRMLTSAEYGTAELLTTVSQLVVPVCSLAIQNATYRFSMDPNHKPENALRNSLYVCVFASVLIGAVSFGLNWYSSLSEYTMFFMLISVLSMFRSVLSIYTNATLRTVTFSVDNVLYNTSLAAFNVVFVAIFKLGLEGYFLAMVASYCVSIVFLVIRSKLVSELRRSTWNKSLLKEMLLYSAPLIINSVSWGLTHVVDKVMLSAYASESATGLYSAASKIPSLLSLVAGVFSQVWTLSVVADYESEKDTTFYRNIFDFTHIGVGLFAAAILLVNNSVFVWVLGDDFAESAKYVPVLLLGTVFLTYTNYYSSVFSAMKKSDLTMYSSFAGCLLNVVLNFLLIPRIGIMGACIATTASYVLIAVIRVVMCNKLLPIGIDYRRWVLTLAGLVACAVFVTMDFYPEIASAVAAVVIFVLYSSEIKLLIKTGFKFLKR